MKLLTAELRPKSTFLKNVSEIMEGSNIKLLSSLLAVSCVFFKCCVMNYLALATKTAPPSCFLLPHFRGLRKRKYKEKNKNNMYKELSIHKTNKL